MPNVNIPPPPETGDDGSERFWFTSEPQYTTFADRLGAMRDSFARLDMATLSTALREATVSVEEPADPDPAPVAERERWPQETVWIMPTPNRRGPGRVADITRHPAWNARFEQSQRDRYFHGDLPANSGIYRRPSTGSSYHDAARWYFLGWHENSLPMFAVRMRYPIHEESDIRQAIREMIGSTIRREECGYCWDRHPVTVDWPMPARTVSIVDVSGNGRMRVCSRCATDWTRCEEAGCLRVGSPDLMTSMIINPMGEQRSVCHEHGQAAAGCPHCGTVFANAALREPHDCVNTGLPWSRCALCARVSRRHQPLSMSDGSTITVCDRDSRQCGIALFACGSCHLWTRYPVIMAGASSLIPNERICPQCIDRHEVEDCEHCEQFYPAVDGHDCAADGNCRCSFCRGGRTVRSYSYKPRARFQGKDRHGLFLGMELEIFVARTAEVEDVARATQGMLGRVGYIKSDGSISHGFEMVTHPMSYEWAMGLSKDKEGNAVPGFPWAVLPMLADRGSFVNEGAGIHVHASRNGFAGAKHEYSWMIFAHRNSAQFSVLARRVSDQWASFDPSQRRDAKDIATKKKVDGRRYRAINQTNAQTIEVRIFMSTTNVQSAQAALGLVHASIEYTRTLRARDAIQDKGWSWSSFVKWVAARPMYAPLYAEMQRLNCVDDVLPPYVVPSDPESTEGYGCPEDCNGNDRCNGSCDCEDCDGTCEYNDDDD
jgi:hypothetical protein